MKRTASFLLIGLLGLTLAQGVRSLGMGGVLLPGPSGQGANPAYASFPGKWDGEGFQVPVGLLRFLPVFADTSPFTYFTNLASFRNNFDFLSAYDQATHLHSFLFNPARSPDEVVFKVSANGISITDGQGKSLIPSFQVGVVPDKPTASIPQPFLPIRLDLGPGTYLSLGSFMGSQGIRIAPNPDLEQAIKDGSFDRCKVSTPSPCALEAQGSLTSGISLALGFSTPLPEIPGGLGRVYAGVRGEGFYGLGYAEASAKARPTFDQNGNVSGASYEVRYFLSYPSYLEGTLGQGGGGMGYGLRGDVGLAVDGGDWAFGLGVQNLLGFSQWSGVEVTLVDGTETSRSATTKKSDFSAPIFTLNGAYRLPLEVGELLLAADTRFGATAPTFHIGAEYSLGMVAIRAGFGVEGGLRLGLGAGFNLETLNLDLALTTHEAPLVGGTVYGIAMAVRF